MEGEAKIPAVKLFISQLGVAKQALGAAGLVGLVLHSVEFTRVWLQGTVVEVDIARRSFLVDDGTGTIAAIIALPGVADDDDSVDPGDGAHGLPERGAYVLLVGAVGVSEGKEHSSCGRYRILCDVIKDVGSESPNRCTLWGLEVVNYWKSRHR